MSSEKLTKKQNILQVVKFVLFSASAAIIQTAVFALLNDVVRLQGWFLTYFPALVASVLWNFTFNRKYTFKSAANVPVAMLKVALFYCVFTPLSLWWGDALEKAGWLDYLVLAFTMIINLVTEFLYCRFFVYRNNMNNNDVAEKERQRSAEDTSRKKTGAKCPTCGSNVVFVGEQCICPYCGSLVEKSKKKEKEA